MSEARTIRYPAFASRSLPERELLGFVNAVIELLGAQQASILTESGLTSWPPWNDARADEHAMAHRNPGCMGPVGGTCLTFVSPLIAGERTSLGIARAKVLITLS